MRIPGAWLLAVLMVASTCMTLAAAVTGWLEIRKTQVTQADTLEWKDSVSHTAMGLERAFLQFRGRLAGVLAGDASPQAREDLSLRHEVLVSRIDLLESTQGIDRLAESAAFRQLLPRLQAWTVQAEPVLAAPVIAPGPGRALLSELDGMADAVQSTTRAAASLTADRIDEQFVALQKQTLLTGSLAALQLLLLAVGALVLRSWHRQQMGARQRLEQLAGQLGEAKQAAEVAALAKSQFLANMSHELRTPFQGVLGMLQLLERSALSAQQRELVGTARGSAAHLLSILNEILDLSAIEAGGASLRPEPVDLHALCREVEGPMRVQAEERGLDLRFDLPVPPTARVLGDAMRIKQVLFNLLNNAIKFTPRGHVRFALHVAELPGGMRQLRFVVEDTGIGMDAATMGRLFQRFAPGDGSLTRRFGGAGLGLEISRTLARLMGGDLEARSEPGRGSTFVMSLALPACAEPVPHLAAGAAPGAGVPARGPAANAAPARPVHPSPTPPGPCTHPKPLRILVADDHPINRRYLGMALESLLHQASFCADGQEALRALQAEPFDLVLMDIHMPVMDGLQATRALRELPGPVASTPVFALSADVMAGSRERALEAGCNAFLAKPVHLEQLAEALSCVEPRRAQGLPGPAAAHAPTPRPMAGAPDLPDAQDAPSPLSPRLADLAACLPRDRLRELLAMFFLDDSGTLASLRAALQAADADQAREAGHKAKGSAMLLGLSAVAEAAAAAEAWAREGADPQAAGARVAALDRSLADSRAALTQWLDSAEAPAA